MAAESRDQWRHQFFFLWTILSLDDPQKIFTLIGYGVVHMQLWHHNEGTYDVMKKNHTYSPWGVLPMCHLYTHGLGDTCVKRPLDLSSRSGEDFFIGFRVNPIWLPSRVTSYLWTFCSSWIGSHTYKVSPRSVQPLQRRRFLKVFFFNNMAAKSHDRWHHEFFSVDHFISSCLHVCAASRDQPARCQMKCPKQNVKTSVFHRNSFRYLESRSPNHLKYKH